jgi:hypothetical protein
VVLIGKNYVYYDTLHVPLQAPDTVFQFRITALDLSTHQPVSNLPIDLYLDDTALTHIYDTTDISGTVNITYEYDVADTLSYGIFIEQIRWPSHFRQTQVIKGIPEVITLGVSEY